MQQIKHALLQMRKNSFCLQICFMTRERKHPADETASETPQIIAMHLMSYATKGIQGEQEVDTENKKI